MIPDRTPMIARNKQSAEWQNRLQNKAMYGTTDFKTKLCTAGEIN